MTESKIPGNATDVRSVSSQQDWGDIPIPDISQIEIEDGQPIASFFSEKQQRFLISVLHASFSKKPFIATANVGLFYSVNYPPLVPDVMLGLGAKLGDDWSKKENRAYFVWEVGKPPDIAIEIVCDREDYEPSSKLADYARVRVAYYVVFDPLQLLNGPILRVYELQGTRYRELQDFYLEQIDLGLTLWQGTFENFKHTWLRWCDKSGNLLLTYEEQNAEFWRQRAESERQRAEEQRQRAETERQRAEAERQRADRLAEILKSRGINPDEIL